MNQSNCRPLLFIVSKGKLLRVSLIFLSIFIFVIILRNIYIISNKKSVLVTSKENSLSDKEFHISSTTENSIKSPSEGTHKSFTEEHSSVSSSENSVSYTSKENQVTSLGEEIPSSSNENTLTSSKHVQISTTESGTNLYSSTSPNQNQIITEPSSSSSIQQAIGDLTPKELALINSNVSYSPYLDSNFRKGCPIPWNRNEMIDIMKFWINLAGIHDIPFWMSFGSLIGVLRHKDMVPWDNDLDIGVPDQYEDLIRNISTPREQISKNKINLVTRPGKYCPINGDRLDCKGNVVSSQVDGCSFCGPLARLIVFSSRRMDIFSYTDELRTIEAAKHKYDYEFNPEKLNWYFPLRNCSFMNLVVQCPNQPETILNDAYGGYQPTHKCVNGDWVEI